MRVARGSDNARGRGRRAVGRGAGRARQHAAARRRRHADVARQARAGAVPVLALAGDRKQYHQYQYQSYELRESRLSCHLFSQVLRYTDTWKMTSTPDVLNRSERHAQI